MTWYFYFDTQVNYGKDSIDYRIYTNIYSIDIKAINIGIYDFCLL